MKKLTINSEKREQIIDITQKIQDLISIQHGIVNLFTGHTTAGITLNENFDLDVKKDLLQKLKELAPENNSYRHSEGNSDAHIKSSIIGNSLIVPVFDKKIHLGRWQGILFCEFDGPRKRQIFITEIKNS